MPISTIVGTRNLLGRQVYSQEDLTLILSAPENLKQALAYNPNLFYYKPRTPWFSKKPTPKSFIELLTEKIRRYTRKEDVQTYIQGAGLTNDFIAQLGKKDQQRLQTLTSQIYGAPFDVAPSLEWWPYMPPTGPLHFDLWELIKATFAPAARSSSSLSTSSASPREGEAYGGGDAIVAVESQPQRRSTIARSVEAENLRFAGFRTTYSKKLQDEVFSAQRLFKRDTPKTVGLLRALARQQYSPETFAYHAVALLFKALRTASSRRNEATTTFYKEMLAAGLSTVDVTGQVYQASALTTESLSAHEARFSTYRNAWFIGRVKQYKKIRIAENETSLGDTKEDKCHAADAFKGFLAAPQSAQAQSLAHYSHELQDTSSRLGKLVTEWLEHASSADRKCWSLAVTLQVDNAAIMKHMRTLR